MLQSNLLQTLAVEQECLFDIDWSAVALSVAASEPEEGCGGVSIVASLKTELQKVILAIVELRPAGDHTHLIMLFFSLPDYFSPDFHQVAHIEPLILILSDGPLD